MSSEPARAKGPESAISIFLVAVLGVIAVGLLIKQADTDIARFGMAGEKPVASPQNSTALAGLSVAGLEPVGPPAVYNQDNLYEKIDGKAPFYTDCGFRRLVTRRFAVVGTDDLSVELYLYDMGHLRNAFSVYSRQRRPQAKKLSDVQFGYESGNAMYFVHGRYYIELIGSAESDRLRAAMTSLARAARSVLPESPARMPELEMFPAEGFIPESIKLYVSETFGCADLRNTFAAGYQVDGRRLTAFLSLCATRQDAHRMLGKYRDFLVSMGYSSAKPADERLGAAGAKVFQNYGVNEIIFTVGRLVAGVHEAEDELAGEKLAAMLLEKLLHISESSENDG